MLDKHFEHERWVSPVFWLAISLFFVHAHHQQPHAWPLSAGMLVSLLNTAIALIYLASYLYATPTQETEEQPQKDYWSGDGDR